LTSARSHAAIRFESHAPDIRDEDEGRLKTSSALDFGPTAKDSSGGYRAAARYFETLCPRLFTTLTDLMIQAIFELLGGFLNIAKRDLAQFASWPAARSCMRLQPPA
jgi:hypothetical protein